MEKKVEIMVVEDKPNHVEDAKAYFDPKQEKGIVNVTYVENLAEAEKAMAENNYDVVITDVFFPLDNENTYDQNRVNGLTGVLEKHFPSESRSYAISSKVDEWKEGKTEAPYGVLVAQQAKEKGVPTVFCTDTNHHGSKTEPVNKWSVKEDVFLVDVYLGENQNGYGSHKDWGLAYANVVAQIVKENDWRMLDPKNKKWLNEMDEEERIKVEKIFDEFQI